MSEISLSDLLTTRVPTENPVAEFHVQFFLDPKWQHLLENTDGSIEDVMQYLEEALHELVSDNLEIWVEAHMSEEEYDDHMNNGGEEYVSPYRYELKKNVNTQHIPNPFENVSDLELARQLVNANSTTRAKIRAEIDRRTRNN